MTSLFIQRTSLVISVLFAAAAPVAAQERPAIELTTGVASFVDDATIHEGLVGIGGRVPLSPRVSIGPEFVYMWGKQTIRHQMLTGNVWLDFLPDARSQRVRVTPYVVLGAGLFRYSQQFFNQTYSSTEGAFTAGGGARVWAGPSIYIAPELRLGWELHRRATVTVGIRL